LPTNRAPPVAASNSFHTRRGTGRRTWSPSRAVPARGLRRDDLVGHLAFEVVSPSSPDFSASAAPRVCHSTAADASCASFDPAARPAVPIASPTPRCAYPARKCARPARRGVSPARRSARLRRELSLELSDPIVSPIALHDHSHDRTAAGWKAISNLWSKVDHLRRYPPSSRQAPGVRGLNGYVAKRTYGALPLFGFARTLWRRREDAKTRRRIVERTENGRGVGLRASNTCGKRECECELEPAWPVRIRRGSLSEFPCKRAV
jgi:hypothetical protein